MIIAEIPKANYCSFFCFLLTMDECIINVWGYTEILPISQIEKIQPFWTIISRDPDQTSRFCGISISCFCWSRVFRCSLLFSVQSMAWQATFDVITSWPFMRPPWKTGGKSLHARVSSLLELKYTSLHFLSTLWWNQKAFLYKIILPLRW